MYTGEFAPRLRQQHADRLRRLARPPRRRRREGTVHHELPEVESWT